MAGAARRSYRAGHACLSHWTHHGRKGIAPGLWTNRRGSACAGAGGDICHGVFRPHGNFLKSAKRHFAGFDTGVGGRGNAGRVSCAPFGDRGKTYLYSSAI